MRALFGEIGGGIVILRHLRLLAARCDPQPVYHSGLFHDPALGDAIADATGAQGRFVSLERPTDSEIGLNAFPARGDDRGNDAHAVFQAAAITSDRKTLVEGKE